MTIPAEVLNSAAKSSRAEVNDLVQKENRLLSSGRAATVPLGSPFYTQHRNMMFSDPHDMAMALDISQKALEMMTASRTVKNKSVKWSFFYL